MIKCKNDTTKIEGSLMSVAQDFINVVANTKTFFSKYMPIDVASRSIITCVKIAYAVDEEEKSVQLQEELLSTFKEGYDRREEVQTDG